MPQIPIKTRMLIVGKKIERHFANLNYHKEEGKLLDAMIAEAPVFESTQSSCANWSEFRSSMIGSEITYSSLKNIKKLLNRLGIDDPLQQANRILRGDFETLITDFQGLRTALAHGAPPQIVISDIRNRLADMNKAVRVIDRILYLYVDRVFGSICWEQLC